MQVWSEADCNTVVSASGDGGLQVWDLSRPAMAPLSLREHKKEVYSVDWSRTRQEQHILSASWDCSVKLVCSVFLKLLEPFYITWIYIYLIVHSGIQIDRVR